jgi:nucleoside 2-deoxyribosyltransferase
MFNAELGAHLRRAGHEVYLPQEQETAADDPEHSFRNDLAHLDRSTVVVGIMDGADPDSGTSWEIGYAFGTKHPIILLRTDMRASNDAGAPYNLMLTESATERIELAIPSVEDAARAVLDVLARLEEPS